jgi:hypothetical protein
MPTARQFSYQGAADTNGTTLFGRAIEKALNGGASTAGKMLVSARDVFDYITPIMAAEAAVDEAVMVTEAATTFAHLKKEIKQGNVKMTKAELKKAGAVPVFTQTPVLVLPPGDAGVVAQDFPVCFCCGHPASPERPFIVRVRTNDVTVMWSDPIFEGVTPTRYHLLMRSTSRNYSGWNEVPNAVEIRGCSFTVKNLPAGLPVDFKVRAFNPGGWSTFSDISTKCTPGADLTPPTTEERWRRIAQGGTLAIIDMLNYNSTDRLEYKIGLSRLMDYAQKNQGYKKDFQTKIADIAIHALVTFKGDSEIMGLAFLVAGYSLMNSKSPKKVRVILLKGGIVSMIEELLKNNRDDPRIIGAIAWLRSKLPKNVPSNPAIIYEEKEEKESEEFLAEQEETEETDDSIFRALAKVA